jgi:glycosyltransferase involved in cell wall biosynthesis
VRGYDVVHLHAQIDRFFLPQMIARLAGRRVIQSCTLADGMGHVLDSYRRGKRLVRQLLRATIDAAVTISPALRDDSLRVLPPERVVLIPQGVFIPTDDAPADARAAARARWGIDPTDCVLLFVGGLCARKGVRTLVDAMPGLLADNPTLRLLIVGPDLEPEYAAGLRAAAAPLGGAVIFTGFQDRPGDFYRFADIFVFASHQEGFGNVLLEAMAARLPVICRRLPGVTDWILGAGALGLLFVADTEYPALVRRLATDPAARRSLGASGREAVKRRFEMGAVAARYARLYEGATIAHENG